MAVSVMEALLQVGNEAAGLEHLEVGARQRLEGDAWSRGQVAHLLRGPVDLDLVPALDEAEDAGAR